MMVQQAQLAGQLAAFVPANALEQQHKQRMLALLERYGVSALARNHFTPGHFTASAFVLSADASRLLLVLHGKLHRWVQPGGHVDPEDPTLAAAAIREVREETALSEVELVSDVPFDVDVHPIPAIAQFPSHEHFDVRFLLRARSDGAVAGSDARDVRWCSPEEIDGSGSDESVLRAVRKIPRELARRANAQ